MNRSRPAWAKDFERGGLLFVITGPSGVGKTTIIDRLLKEEEDLAYSVSHTTREKRAGERHGRDYYFVDEEEFCRLKGEGEFLEWARVYGEYYGTSRSEVNRKLEKGQDVLMDIDIQGAQGIMASEIEAAFIFVGPPSKEELLKRLQRRGSEGDEQKDLRLSLAQQELSQVGEFDYLVINDRLEEAVGGLRAIVRAERLRLPL